MAALHPPQTTDLPYSRPATPGAHDTALHIGWVGIGAIGTHIASNLATQPCARPAIALPIRVFNRTKEKVTKLQRELGEDKIAHSETLEDLVATSDVIFTSLPSDTIVSDVYRTFADALKTHPPSKAKIFVETSTIYPKLAGELDTLISSLPRCHFVTSPVFGAPAAAQKRQLIACMSGDYQSKKTIAHILVPAAARKVNDLGGNVEQAPTFKLIGNATILSSIEVMAEAYTMAAKAGIDQEAVWAFIQDIYPSSIWLNYGNKMLNNTFDGSVGFAIDGGIKDASHMRRLAQEMNCPQPTVDVAFQNLLSARAQHQAQARVGAPEFPVLDWSALVAGTRVAAGLPGMHHDQGSRVEKED